MAKIRAIVGVHSNALLVRTPYSGGVLLVRAPYLSFRGLPYSLGPPIITPPTRQDPILLRHLLARTPYYYATYSLGPHILCSKMESTRQDPIFLGALCSSEPHIYTTCSSEPHIYTTCSSEPHMLARGRAWNH